MQELKATEQQAHHLISTFDQKSEETLQKVYDKFWSSFSKFFQMIVPQGVTDVRVVKQ